jgi:hypothetical protein
MYLITREVKRVRGLLPLLQLQYLSTLCVQRRVSNRQLLREVTAVFL